MTERIDHAAEALSFLGGAVIDTYGDDDRKVAIAHVHATLALVEQQRIANLISMYGAEPRGEDATRFTPIPKITDAALNQAIGGLGLS